ncbi:MAG: TonB-dependent receptor plug domain-containing protein, partial [Bradyrhizobium guangdongense]
MSSVPKAARRHSSLLLASSFLALSVTAARAQVVAEQLPPVEITKPGDQNQTRARATGEPTASAPRRATPSVSQGGAASGTSTATGTTASAAGSATASGGIVGAATTVITAADIAHSPVQSLAEIIATQTPGAQINTLYGGPVAAKTTVDLRGFGAFASANTLVLINGRRLNDI